jgi:hypothetical protein
MRAAPWSRKRWSAQAGSADRDGDSHAALTSNYSRKVPRHRRQRAAAELWRYAAH